MPLLSVHGLKKSFGEMHAVDGIDLTVEREELVSLVGSNGAGKTTLVNLITGLLRPDEGTIRFQEQDITALPIHERIKAGISRSFQLVNLFDQLTSLDNLRLTVFSREGKASRALSLAERDRPVTDQAVQILRDFGVEAKRGTPAAGLAQGERKLLDVAVAHALRPKLILLDEPTSGVGTREKSQIMDIISAVVKELGLTAIIVEHDMDVVFKYSDRIVAMHQGRILAQGTPDQIRADARVTSTLLGQG